MEKSLFPAELFVSQERPWECLGTLAEPPTEEVSVGYRSWCVWPDDPDEPRVDCRIDYFVRPDGSARIHREDEIDVEDEILPMGAWTIESMSGSFGSRGGREIIPA